VRYSETLSGKLQIFQPHMDLTSPVGMTPLEFHQCFSYRKLKSLDYDSASTASWSVKSF